MKKLNNKGFSLVELIIVIAIMAILIAVLAPQFLRYVERSRLQKDNTAISEIANAAKVAMANDTVNNTVPAGATAVGTVAGKVYTFTGAANTLNGEVAAVVGTPVTLSSTTYTTAPTINVNKNATTGVVTVTADIIQSVGVSANTVTF